MTITDFAAIAREVIARRSSASARWAGACVSVETWTPTHEAIHETVTAFERGVIDSGEAETELDEIIEIDAEGGDPRYTETDC
jgi:hypothetical protein